MDKKDKAKKVSSNPIADAIDNYIENEYQKIEQTAQPLNVLDDKLPIDKKTNYYKKPDNKIIIKSLYRWRGIKSSVAIDLRCSRNTLNKWIDSDKELQEAYKDSCEYSIDHAESKLNELIDGVLVQDYDFDGKPLVYRRPPDQKAIAFYLSTKAKHRGYTTKTETELSGKTEQVISFKES